MKALYAQYLKLKARFDAIMKASAGKPSVNVVMPNVDTLVPWTGKENCRHNVRVICDLEAFSEVMKDDLSSTVHCESNYNPACVHPNIFNGKVSTTDYGIAQINDYWHIGEGKDFPSTQFVLDNPEACIRWMCKEFLAGRGREWVCKLRSLNKMYTP